MEQWGFECSCCGKYHDGLPMCIWLGSPTLRAMLPAQERDERCFLTQDLCVIDDKRFFIYGSLAIPISDGSGPFIWGVWAEVSEEDFFRYQDLLGVEGRETEPSIPATLGSDIPLYPPMLELGASVVHQPAGERPLSFYLNRLTRSIGSNRKEQLLSGFEKFLNGTCIVLDNRRRIRTTHTSNPMGNLYTNYTLRGPSPQAIVAVLAGRSAIVTPAQDGCVVVFDEESDEQDTNVITQLASRLSRELRCPVLAVLNHDDDILWYQLYLSGELADEYDSSPGYFDPAAEPSAPAGGDAKKLCSAFGASAIAEVESVLRKSSFDEDGYTFAVERHEDLARALGIPSFGVGAGFGYVARGELPEGLAEDTLIRV